MHFLKLHFENIIVDTLDLLTFHILCLTKLKNLQFLSNKFHIVSCYKELGTTIIYDKTILLAQNISITNYGIKFITRFKIKIHDKQYVYNSNL